MSGIDYSYQGFYARFESPDKPTGSLLMGPDNLVGDDYEVVFKNEDDRIVAWLKNKFGAEIGFLDVDASRSLQLANGRGQKIRALLSFVAYSDSPDPGLYWGEVALFCYNETYDAEIGAFINRCSSRLADGKRPEIDLGRSSIEKIFSEEDWMPTQTVPYPKKETGMAILKQSRSLSEKMIEQGRARNKGCYVVSWLFIIIVIAAVLFGLHSAGLF
ncbi:MAG: hypothetical protein E7Z99_05380 [Coriobacteriaceae bacterium]|nr:hypothetical protein [Coriobacteriaceae bacterium]